MSPHEQKTVHCQVASPVPRRHPAVLQAIVSFVPPAACGAAGTWAVDHEVMQLQHDDDEVVWDLSAVWRRFPGAEVQIVFTSGPVASFDRAKGPFRQLVVEPRKRQARGVKRNQVMGRYDYEIRIHQEGDVTIDPQIDNLPPPPPKPPE
jgi:hypothetical protein